MMDSSRSPNGPARWIRAVGRGLGEIARELRILSDQIHLAVPLSFAMGLWGLTAGATLGMGTWLLVFEGGRRVRSTALRVWGYIYLTITITMLIAGCIGKGGLGVAAACWLFLWTVGAVHCASIGRRVWYACRDELVVPPR